MGSRGREGGRGRFVCGSAAVYQYLPKSSQPAKIFLTTDGHGLTRMKTGFLLSVSIRVHPWLEHIGCGFAALCCIAGFQPAECGPRSNVLPITNRRYGRVQLCATDEPGTA